MIYYNFYHILTVSRFKCLS